MNVVNNHKSHDLASTFVFLFFVVAIVIIIVYEVVTM